MIACETLGEVEFKQFTSESLALLCGIVKPKMLHRPQTLREEDSNQLSILNRSLHSTLVANPRLQRAGDLIANSYLNNSVRQLLVNNFTNVTT